MYENRIAATSSASAQPADIPRCAEAERRLDDAYEPMLE
jgi:hypothetical protein